MLKLKIYNLMERDELIWHKVGFVVGAIFGIVGGLFISERAEHFQEIIEEVVENAPESQ